MTYRSCVGCVHGSGFCHARELVKAHVKGIGVTSLKWRCNWRRPIYQPGDAVWANIFTGWEDQGDSWGREEANFVDFPGIVIRLKGSRAVIFIEPGADSYSGDYSFEPMKNGNGHVKIPIVRTRKRDAVREHICDSCERFVRLKGHEDWCRHASADQRRASEEQYVF